MGDELTYENLEITFLVDEKLENYIELHNWLVGIGFPDNRNQFTNFRTDNQNAFPDSGKSAETQGVQGMFGDATLTITSAKNNPIVEQI